MKCEDCCHAEMCKWIDELEGRGCDFGEPWDDAISREKVMDIISDYYNVHDTTAHEEEIMENMMERVEQLPSVTPSRRKGHWITKIDDTAHNFPFGKRVECSECGQVFVTGDSVSRNYCPNCGAKMVEPQESEEISERNMKMWEEIFKAERR